MINASHVILFEHMATFRRAVADALRTSMVLPGIRVDEVDSADAMISALQMHDSRHELAICCLDRLKLEGIADFRSLTTRFPLVSFVVTSASDSLLIPQQAYAAGAAGFFRRDSPMHLVLQILDTVLGAEAFAIPGHLRAGPGLA
jgi:DNA-binding NarL/FixJ family response regulator